MAKLKVDKKVLKILEKKKQINLDLGCGDSQREGFIGMDVRPLPNVDIVHDIEVFPYPIPDGVCNTIIMSHVWEHIKPWLSMRVMDEVWRLLKEENIAKGIKAGKVALSFPYGVSFPFVQDPTHCNPSNEATWDYFDPNCFLYNVYKPKPFAIEHRSWQVGGFMEVVLRKISVVEGEKRNKAFLEKTYGKGSV